jgi:regulatory protein
MTSDPAAGSEARGHDAAGSPDHTRVGHRGVGWHGDVAAGVVAWTGGAPAEPPVAPPPDVVAEGPDADPEAVARKILLDALTGQARSRRELRDKLARRDVPPELAERLLDRFTEVGLIDDDAFARAWVESRQRSRGLARRALAQELRRKGVDDETARCALDDLDPADEEDAARALVRKKLRTLRGVDTTTATRRLAGLLARKGYPAGMAFAVVRDELGAVDDDPT